jgi:hypothetical protein
VTPRVSDDPVLHAALVGTLSDDANVMSDSFALISNDFVCLESFGLDGRSVDTACEGSIGGNFVHHHEFDVTLWRSGLVDGTPLVYGEHIVAVWYCASGFLQETSWFAVLANQLSVATNSFLPPLCLVVATSFFSNAVFDDPLVDPRLISAVAAIVTVIFAGYQRLHSNVHVRKCSLAHDLDSVGQRRGRCEGPAGSALLGDVLVAYWRRLVHCFSVD